MIIGNKIKEENTTDNKNNKNTEIVEMSIYERIL